MICILRYAALVLGISSTLAVSAQDVPPLVLVDGRHVAGDATSVEAGTLTLTAVDATQAFAPGQWLRWQHPVAPEPRPQLLFGERSRLVAKRDWTGKVPITLDQSSATIQTTALGKLTIDRQQVRCLLIEAAKEPAVARQLLSEAAKPSTTDRVWLTAGDQLSGKVKSFDGTTLQLEYAGDTVPILAKDTAAIALATPPALATKPRYFVGLADGSFIEARDVGLSASELTIVAADTWKTKKVDQLVYLQSLDSSITYLSDLEPVDFRHTPYFTGEWPLARDQSLAGATLQSAGQRYAKGLAMHSAARAVYRVPAGAKQLLADVAIDDATQGGGSVLFRIYRVGAEGVKLAAESTVVRGGDPPQSLAVEVAGFAAVVLTVDYAEDGDQQDHAQWLDARFVQVEVAPEPAETNATTEPQPLHLAGLENVFRLTSRITSGSGPDTDQAFAALAEQGIKTVVSVDGATPHVELAHKHGLRYIHIPIGYDGLSREAELALARVARETDGPVYIHCHHGKHRGPAAAAIACLASGELDPAAAKHVLQVAGTSQKYRGLWRDVAEFQPPQPDETLPELVETATVTGRVAAMSQLDAALEQLAALESNQWQAPTDHPDLNPAEQATLLWQGYRESQRFSQQQGEADLAQRFDPSITQAEQLRQALETGDQATATTLLGQLKQSCATCHEQYRNNR